MRSAAYAVSKSQSISFTDESVDYFDSTSTCRSTNDFEIRRNISEFAVSRRSASSRSRRRRSDSLSARTVGALRRFGVAGFRRRDLTDAEPALERRRIAHPKAQDYADFQVALQQGFALGEMGFNDKFALQTILNSPYALIGLVAE